MWDGSLLAVWTSDQTLLVLIFLLKYYSRLITTTPGLRTHQPENINFPQFQLVVICNAGNVISVMKINGNLISTISLIAPKLQSHNLPIFISPPNSNQTTKIPKSLKLKPEISICWEKLFLSGTIWQCFTEAHLESWDHLLAFCFQVILLNRRT